MSRLRSLRSLWSVLFVPVLAMLLALAGIAGARASAERIALPSVFSLCSGGEQSDGGHDCLDCCLPHVATTASPNLLPTLWSSVVTVLRGEGADFALAGFGLPAPLSRGPPVRAFA